MNVTIGTAPVSFPKDYLIILNRPVSLVGRVQVLIAALQLSVHLVDTCHAIISTLLGALVQEGETRRKDPRADY